MCLSRTNTKPYYIYTIVYLACTVDSISLQITASTRSLGQSPFALPKGASEVLIVLLLAGRQHTFCVSGRDPRYIWLSLAPTILFITELKSCYDFPLDKPTTHT